MNRGVRALSLSLLLLCGCKPVLVKTNVALLAEKIRPETKIRCVAAFTVARWHNQGLVYSPDDSLGLGKEYLDLLCAELTRKGYTPESLGVADINWPLEEGKKVPVVRGTPLRVSPFKLFRTEFVHYDAGQVGNEEQAPLNIPGASSGGESLRDLARDTARKAEPLLRLPSQAPKQEALDKWTESVLQKPMADPSKLAEHCKSPDLLLVLWGNACAASKWQQLKRINWLSVVIQAALQARSRSATVVLTKPANSLALRAVLLDPATGTPLWFASQTAVESDRIVCPLAAAKGCVMGLLVGLPEAKNLSGEASQKVYGKPIPEVDGQILW